MDDRIQACTTFLESGGQPDMSVQVTIPNEWDQIAPINIGVTAGIESNKVSHVWLEKANLMDKVITISEHSKKGFTDTKYTGEHKETRQPMKLECETPVEIVHYPVKQYNDATDVGLDLEYDFNYLAVAQWGPRKNLENLVRWFVEENIDQEVGLVLKTSLKNNSIVDREYAEYKLRGCIPDIPDRKCKIYLLHGDMSEQEMHSLYKHPKIKAMVSLTHGEGYGLPLFEAAYSGVPIIAPGWSGHADFLYAPPEPKNTRKNKKKSLKRKPYFAHVDYTLGPVQDFAVWPGVIEKDSMWAYPTEGSFKMLLRRVRKDYDKWLKRALYLQEWICKEFESEKLHNRLADVILPAQASNEEIDLLFDSLISTSGDI